MQKLYFVILMFAVSSRVQRGNALPGKGSADETQSEEPQGSTHFSGRTEAPAEMWEKKFLEILSMPKRPTGVKHRAPDYMRKLYSGISLTDEFKRMDLPSNGKDEDSKASKMSIPTVRSFGLHRKGAGGDKNVPHHPDRLVFDLGSIPSTENIALAELVLHRQDGHHANSTPYEVGVFEILDDHGNTHLSPVDSQTLFSKKTEQKFDVFDSTRIVRTWFQGQRNHGMLLVVKTSDGINLRKEIPSIYKVMPGEEDEPLLVVYSNFGESDPRNIVKTNEVGKQRGHRRIRKRSASGTTNCHVEEWYVDFAEMGLDDFILEPKGHYINYCSGQCPSLALGIGSSGTNNAFIRSWFKSALRTSRPNLPASFCGPKKFSAMSMFYIDEHGFANIKQMPDMIVDECVCL